jgi:hypothetical protein
MTKAEMEAILNEELAAIATEINQEHQSIANFVQASMENLEHIRHLETARTTIERLRERLITAEN